MTFSLIEGGREINIVPDECTTRLDFRTTPDYSKDYVDKLIKTNIKIVKSKDKKFQIEWKYDLGNEGYVVDEKEEIVKSLKKSIKQVYKKSPAIVANGPSHIGTLLTKEGVPTVVWGPRGGNVHSYNEYVEINSIPKTSLIYLNSVLDYFGLC
jgi:acetylornithine deacetylase/succinyl-diaminopimelate desuccinylase-like protein